MFFYIYVIFMIYGIKYVYKRANDPGPEMVALP